MMDDQSKNLILATALSFAVILIWLVLFPPPEPQPRTPAENQAATDTPLPNTDVATVPLTVETGDSVVTDPVTAADDAPRVRIETPRLTGSISLVGGRVDDLSLKDYRTDLSDDAPIVNVLRPIDVDQSYYALYGWAAGSGLTSDQVPGPNTRWEVGAQDMLTPETPIILSWTNDTGVVFNRQISVDQNFMFTITQTVRNNTNRTIALAPYGIIARHGEPEGLRNFFILHEGAVAMADGELIETDYDDFEPARSQTMQTVIANGWVGFTDHFWMTTLVPSPGMAFEFGTFFDQTRNIYQTTARLPVVTVGALQTAETTTQLFAGAKEWEAILTYQSEGIDRFIDSIDWGWFFFLTKPIFWMLHELNLIIGNMGWSIIALTLIIKAVLFPLAYKSYVSMAKMKELQPLMEELKERAGDDRKKMQQGMMEIYKKEKVNPAAGCLPILLQIPIFFSLYKVIFVTIELRHAPWFGPFRDLSAPDPTSILNLFGLLGFAGPPPGSIMALIFIGILPLLLGVSMWLQQKLNPAPTDPTQKMIFAWLPWVFMFMLGSFASGLVVYWIANNAITFAQQYTIMRTQGYRPDVFGNILDGFKRDKKAVVAPKDKIQSHGKKRRNKDGKDK